MSARMARWDLHGGFIRESDHCLSSFIVRRKLEGTGQGWKNPLRGARGLDRSPERNELSGGWPRLGGESKLRVARMKCN